VRVLPPVALLALAAGAALAYTQIAPLIERRERDAGSAAPDLVSLSYLKLGLAERPADRALRLQLAERLLQAGLLAEAADTLLPLAAQPDAASTQLALEIELVRWLALPVAEVAERAVAQGRLRARLEQRAAHLLEASALERFAEICAASGQLELLARVAGEQARRQLNEANVARADAAYLALNEPAAAARLWAELALAADGAAGARHALTALVRARSADQPLEALALFARLEPRFGADERVLELGLAISAGQGAQRELEIAERLLALRPHDAALGGHILELRRALHTAEPPLPRSAPAPLGPAEERARAQASWELERVVQLAPAQLEQRADLEQQLEALEALGRAPEALALLHAALAGTLAADAELWQRALALELASGQLEAALGTLQQMERRFGLQPAYVEQHAALLLGSGQLQQALELLQRAPGGGAELARQAARLGWELGQPQAVRHALEPLVASKAAEARDFEQLWQAQQADHILGEALATAREGYRRFATTPLLRLGLRSALELPDEAAALELLEHAAAPGSPLREDAELWLLHAQLYERAAQRAYEAGQLADARAHSSRAGVLLERAGELAPEARWLAGARQSQRRQALSLALEADDLPAVAALYEQQQSTLGEREQLGVLQRLGQYSTALARALSVLEQGGQGSAERDALEAEARALGAELPRQLWLRGQVAQLAELGSWSAAGGAEYTLERGLQLGAEAQVTRFEGAALSAAPWLAGVEPLELSVGLRGVAGDTALALGVALQPNAVARPFAGLEQGLLDSEQVQLGVALAVNEASQETAPLRLGGAQDRLALSAHAALGEHWLLSAVAGAQSYWQRDRSYLGAGGTLSTSVGYQLPALSLGTASVRASAYVAPRFAAAGAGERMAEGTSWFGVSAGLRTGQLDLPPVFGFQLAWLADATLGWLVPQEQLGWSGRLGLGTSLVGADLFSFSLQASNVLGTAPGLAAYTLGADYRLSQWK
jgi:hypothetical protein